jgi:lysylphosphatidylglycerol synthetase-like protein (DUF2156 family)
METIKIIAAGIVAAVFYGIVHDQITSRVCIEYFTVFHPPVFSTQSPTLLAFGWGIIASWWMGAFLAILLAFAARAGSRPKLSLTTLLQPIGELLAMMAACAFLSGLIGFVLTKRGAISPPAWVSFHLAPAVHARFMADWYAHNASYAVGFFGGIIVCVLQYRRRRQPIRISTSVELDVVNLPSDT